MIIKLFSFYNKMFIFHEPLCVRYSNAIIVSQHLHQLCYIILNIINIQKLSDEVVPNFDSSNKNYLFLELLKKKTTNKLMNMKIKAEHFACIFV